MSELYVSGHKDAQQAQEKRRELELRGWTVTVFGPADRMAVDTTKLDGGCVASSENGWVVVGKKD